MLPKTKWVWVETEHLAHSELGHHCAATAAVARESGGPEAALWPDLGVHYYMFSIKYGCIFV